MVCGWLPKCIKIFSKLLLILANSTRSIIYKYGDTSLNLENGNCWNRILNYVTIHLLLVVSWSEKCDTLDLKFMVRLEMHEILKPFFYDKNWSTAAAAAAFFPISFAFDSWRGYFFINFSSFRVTAYPFQLNGLSQRTIKWQSFSILKCTRKHWRKIKWCQSQNCANKCYDQIFTFWFGVGLKPFLFFFKLKI